METRQPGFWAAALTTYIAALTAFVLRIVARRLKGLTLFFDDYLALAAFVRPQRKVFCDDVKLMSHLGFHDGVYRCESLQLVAFHPFPSCD